jgi:hypothetical protein
VQVLFHGFVCNTGPHGSEIRGPSCKTAGGTAYLVLRQTGRSVPSLFRFLIIVGVLAGAAYGAMWGVATYVEPQPREMTQTLPANKLAGK